MPLRRPQKQSAAQRQVRVACRRRFPDPLVDAGNPPLGDALGEKTHSTRVHHCLVALETSPSGPSKTLPHENATVMLGIDEHNIAHYEAKLAAIEAKRQRSR